MRKTVNIIPMNVQLKNLITLNNENQPFHLVDISP